MNIRTGKDTDIRGMVAIAETKRIEYEGYSPVFWRKASDSALTQELFFPRLLASADVIALVVEEGEALCGFLISAITIAPPVHNPGGPVCIIRRLCGGQAAGLGHGRRAFTCGRGARSQGTGRGPLGRRVSATGRGDTRDAQKSGGGSCLRVAREVPLALPAKAFDITFFQNTAATPSPKLTRGVAAPLAPWYWTRRQRVEPLPVGTCGHRAAPGHG